MKYAYYPGCSSETTAKEYNQSALAVCHELGIELVELPDWNCCSSSSGHSTDYWLCHALAGRNLAIAEKENMDVIATCPSCFLRLRDTRNEVTDRPEVKQRLQELIDLPYEAKNEVKHLLDVLYTEIGIEKIREKVINPLTGLKLVSFYGCYLVRPPELTGFDDPENPQTMDILLAALGAEVVDWKSKVDCCGGSLSFSKREVIKELVAQICSAAHEVDAEAIVTACGLCHANLESRQTGEKPLPVFYFTELIGMALGCDVRPWFKKHLINPVSLLRTCNLLG